MNDISNCSDTATLSVLENTKWMGKKFTINEFGNLQKQSNGLFIKGKVLPLEIMTSSQLKILTNNLQANHALCLGIPKQSGDILPVAARALQKKLHKNNLQCLSRTKDDFMFPLNQGWLLIDYDIKDQPVQVTQKIDELGGILPTLKHIWPELDQADYLIRPSSSAGVHIEGDTHNNANGFHTFVRLQKAQQIPQSLLALHARCWENGLGYFIISKSGQLLDRSIIDVSVGSPERLIFTADPILGIGVKRDLQHIIQQNGSALQKPQMPLNFKWNRHRDIRKQQRQPKAHIKRQEFINLQIEQHIKMHGGSHTQAKAIVAGRISGRCISDNDSIELADGSVEVVGDILDKISRNCVMPCADPIEGRDYNPTAASILWGSTHKAPALISHAHGLTTVYRFERFEKIQSNKIGGK